jgi:Homeodomain-like domain
MAIELYSKSLSLEEVAGRLGRSTSGVYKILKEDSCPIRTGKKVDTRCKETILRLYCKEGMSAPVIAKRLGIAKRTVLYWLRRAESPIQASIRNMAGSNLISISSGALDLLPFVEPSYLRWVDDVTIMMRIGNSRPAVISRTTDAKSFFRLAGFYLAEGSKTTSHADVSNTNLDLIAYYRGLALSFVRTEIRTYDIQENGSRAAQQLVAIGGICLKRLLLNAIEGILEFLSNSTSFAKDRMILGLGFLNGYSGGMVRWRNQNNQRVASKGCNFS